jgi:LAGLIDADG-like domain
VTDPYLAGLFDGEGCVTIWTRRNGAIVLILAISNGHRGVLEQCQERFGGSIRKKTRTENAPVYDWQVSGPKAEVFARAILPFSIVKAAQLELFLEARSILQRGQSRKLTDPEAAARHAFADRLRQLRRVA